MEHYGLCDGDRHRVGPDIEFPLEHLLLRTQLSWKTMLDFGTQTDAAQPIQAAAPRGTDQVALPSVSRPLVASAKQLAAAPPYQLPPIVMFTRSGEKAHLYPHCGHVDMKDHMTVCMHCLARWSVEGRGGENVDIPQVRRRR